MPTPTANMNLSIPLSGETNYPTSISNSLTNIDLHDHTSGKGVQVPTAGIEDDAITTVKIADLNVTTGKLAANAVTRAKMAAVGQQQTGNINFTTASITYVDITGASIVITTTGRPVFIALVPNNTSAISYIRSSITSPVGIAGTEFGIFIKLVRDATDVQTHNFSVTAEQTSFAMGASFPVNLLFFDVPGSGTYTYKLQGQTNDVNQLLDLFNCRLVAYEL